MPMFGPGAQHFGKTTPLAAAAAQTPQINFGKGVIKLWIYHYIAGYSGTSIALLQFGSGGTIDTAGNYNSNAFHLTATAASVACTIRGAGLANFNGIPVANDATTNGRRGLHEAWNLGGGEPLMCDARTNTYNGAPNASSIAQLTMSCVNGHWWGAAQADCVRLTGGATGINLQAGSYIDVWGVPAG